MIVGVMEDGAVALHSWTAMAGVDTADNDKSGGSDGGGHTHRLSLAGCTIKKRCDVVCLDTV